MTSLVVLQNGTAVRQGLEVNIHWTGAFSGSTKKKTGTSGYVTLDDDLLKGNSRKANIYVQNPKGGHSLKFSDITIKKGEKHILDLDLAG